MDQNELNNLVKQQKISTDQILREEAEMFFLNALAEDKLGSKLGFYGGTALRLAYGSPRFSEDIDLIQLKSVKWGEFKNFIQQTVKKNSNWSVKDIKNKRQTMFALILIKDEKLKHNFSLRIEVHKFAKKTDLKPELLLIKSPASILEPLVLAFSLEELKKLKTEALQNRKKARDIFDLWYISCVLKQHFELPGKSPQFKKQEFQNELKVFLPQKYFPVINELYEKINR